MRLRVAFIVTLASLVVLTVLFSYNCKLLADETNEDVLVQTRNFCTNISSITADYTREERLEVLKRVSAGRRIVAGLYDEDGHALYVTNEAYDELSAEEMAFAEAGKTKQDRQRDANGNSVIVAIYRYEDGAFLVFEAAEATLITTVIENPGFILLVVVFTLSMVAIFIVLRQMRRREQYLDSVMRALDSFADGNFEARISDFPSDDPEVEKYNAVMGRIQERVFRQRNRNQALSMVMSQMQNGVIAVDGSMHVIYVNSIAKKLLGIVGNVEGLHINETSKDVKLDHMLAKAMDMDSVYTNDVAARTAEGRGHRPLRLYMSRIQQDDGKPGGVLAIVEDITDLKMAEQARTDFAANVSHELKTPLTSIQGFVETLDAGAIDNPEMAHKFLKIIMTETNRLARLINDILSISKLESGETEVALERIRLDKKAFDVCNMLTVQADAKHVTIHNRLNDEPVYIFANPDRVEQLLINLTENAIKYNREGGSVTVQVFANDKEANISIADTGIGIAEEHLPRLFERFYRVDKGRSRQMGGTGLGLAIVKHIVRSMNGEIEVHSKLGEGTEFLITLPLAAQGNADQDTIFGDDFEN